LFFVIPYGKTGYTGIKRLKFLFYNDEFSRLPGSEDDLFPLSFKRGQTRE
jgi:hypothetical protein